MKNNDPVVEALTTHFPPGRLKCRPIDRYAYSSDASFYTLVPRAVVIPIDLEEIALLFKLAKKLDVSITFRTAGTSLSGQAVTDGILVDISKHWGAVHVEDNGRHVRVQPGVTGAMVNHHLRKYGRKIGPDPASIQSAMMGGILSNNSSGMCCGVVDNSYHTLTHIKFMLADGLVFDTGNTADYPRFELLESYLCKGLARLRRQVGENGSLVTRIREKYQRKNTVGYGLNAFLDFEHPLDILAHLLIGGEGTLGFIAEAVLRTIPDKPFKSAALLFFDSPRHACDAIPLLKDSGAEALELMDRAALRSIEHLASAPAFLKELPDQASCILCEYQANSSEELDSLLTHATEQLNTLSLISRTVFTSDEKERGNYWKLRKGMYPSVAAVRAKGTSVMLEDIAVPLDRLGETIELLQDLFRQFNYKHAIVFGHAKDGNLHFVVSQSVATPEDIAVFGAFNDALADLVIHHCQGALKAEHGTGRQVAPYVETEWGSEAYQIMQELKALADPDNIVNPGVILNKDRQCHLQHLKSLPVVEEEVDKCVECGYCEGSCPSRNFTLTPRQRIVLKRSLARLKAAGDQQTHDAILKDYQHDGMDTCAVDGMCATNCPVDINTGELIKRLRKENHSPLANSLAVQVAKNFRLIEWLVKTGLRSGRFINTLFGPRAMSTITGAIKKILPAFPLWLPQLTGPLNIRKHRPTTPGAVYFPTCLTRMMGKDKDGKPSITETLLTLSERAGIGLVIPSGLNGSCCGQAFSSKGFTDAYRLTVNRTIKKLWEWSQQGTLPVIIDISSCSHTLQTCRPYLTPDNQLLYDRLRLQDSLEFAVDTLLPNLAIKKKGGKAMFHPVCSLHKMNLYKKLEELAARTVEEPVIPFTAGCCGMAGDRGFFHPGLIASACRDEGNEAAAQPASGYYSTALTCEMALSSASGLSYRSILYLLEEVSNGRTA